MILGDREKVTHPSIKVTTGGVAARFLYYKLTERDGKSGIGNCYSMVVTGKHVLFAKITYKE